MKIIKVLGSRVLVKYLEPEKAADDGIEVAPSSVNPSYFQGEVLAVYHDLADVSVGDKVCYVKYGYEDMGDGTHMVEENSLIAVYE